MFLFFFLCFFWKAGDDGVKIAIFFVTAESATCVHPFQQVPKISVSVQWLIPNVVLSGQRSRQVYTGKVQQKPLIFFCFQNYTVLTLQGPYTNKQEKYQNCSNVVFSFLTRSGGVYFFYITYVCLFSFFFFFFKLHSSLVISSVHLNDCTCPFLVLFLILRM